MGAGVARSILAACVVLAMLVAAGRAEHEDVRQRPAESGLDGGAGSIEELVDRFLVALGRRDTEALQDLPVSREEYGRFILPGAQPEGRAPKPYPADVAEYFWKTNKTRSHYTLKTLLRKYGGRTLKRRSVEFRDGEKQYQWYKAYKATTIHATDEDGKEVEILIGSIVQSGPRYKFTSYHGD